MEELFDILPTHIFDNIELFVFDFDCTVTNYNLSNLNLHQAQTDMISNFIDVDLFRACVKYFLKQNIHVAVASYGRKNIILTLLLRIFDEAIFDEKNVITPKDMPSCNGKQWREAYIPPSKINLNKNNMLERLTAYYKVKTSHTHLLDDSHINVIRALNAGYQATTAPKEGGFKSSLLALVYNFLNDDALDTWLKKFYSLT